MPRTRFDELKKYVRFDEEDGALLSSFRIVAEPHFVRIAREFYERIREHEAAHAVLSGEEQIERLQRSLVTWMARLLSGTYDFAYYEGLQRVGRVHVRVGLPQRFMFSAMALIRVSFLRLVTRELHERPDVAERTGEALNRIIDLDLAIMVDSYREDLAALVLRREEIASMALKTDRDRALRLYERATDVSPSLIVGIDAKGGIRLFNRLARDVTGFSLEDVFGTAFVELLAPNAAAAQVLVAELLAGKNTQRHADLPILTRAGRTRDVEWTFSPILDEASDGAVLFAIGTDVTDERAAARQLRRHEKLAAVGTLAAGLAHEIRNPLNGAKLHVAFLQRALGKDADPDMVDAAKVVSDEIDRLANLVTEFLDFARPKELDKKRVVVQALLGRAVELTAAAASEAGVEVLLDAPVDDLVVVADAAKIEQVLLNLVQNSIEALAPAKTGTVIVRARRTPHDVIIDVQDDGPGLSTPEAPVFDAFFSTKPTGTGLGLSITHRIVNDHGGTVDVDSRPGRTCFRFTLPVSNGDDS